MSAEDQVASVRTAAAGDRTPQEIEHQIQRTRERMSSNIDALGERLRPDNLKRQAREAIAGKAQDVVSSVGDQARQAGNRVLDFILEHPVPAAAVALGLIWLFSLRGGKRRPVSSGRLGRVSSAGGVPGRAGRPPARRPSSGRTR